MQISKYQSSLCVDVRPVLTMKKIIHAGIILSVLSYFSVVLLAADVQSPLTQPATTEPALGTYHWPNGTAGVDAFAAWLGRDSVWGLDFVGGESWNNVGWPTW